MNNEKGNRKVRDTVFTHLFNNKKYIVQLYSALYPDKEPITEKMVTKLRLIHVFSYGLYNDLSFIAGDKIIVFVEAQSTWDQNITLRILLYVIDTIQKYLKERKINLHQKSKIILPEIDVFLIYTGNNKKDIEVLNLSEEHFENKNRCLNLKVKVIHDSAKGDIIYQYITFCRVYGEQLKEHNGNAAKAIEETIRICIDNDILKDYLEQNRTEVQNIMDELFDQDKIWEGILENERKSAEEKGEKEGIFNLIGKLKEMGMNETILQQAANSVLQNA